MCQRAGQSHLLWYYSSAEAQCSSYSTSHLGESPSGGTWRRPPSGTFAHIPSLLSRCCSWFLMVWQGYCCSLCLVFVLCLCSSLSRNHFVRVLHFVSHGCSGPCYACHVLYLCCLYMLVLSFVILRMDFEFIALWFYFTCTSVGDVFVDRILSCWCLWFQTLYLVLWGL